jgi:phage tail protein X
MTQQARRTGSALEAHFQFLLWLIPAVEKFPRTQKFLLGDRIQTAALDVLDALISATYTRDRQGHLARANLGLEKLRYLFRLAVALKLLDLKRYAHAARQLDETGRMAGGWRKMHDALCGADAPAAR